MKLLWPEVRQIYNNVNKTMKRFLASNFSVREFHLMVEQFPEAEEIPKKLVKRLKESLDNSDQKLFKKEKDVQIRENISAENQHIGSDQTLDERES